MVKWNAVKYLFYVRLVVFLRFLFGPVIFITPIGSFFATFILDWIDGELFKRAGYSREKYSIYDKLLDFYWYVWILLFVFLRDVPDKQLFISLFALRTVGQLAYLTTKRGVFLLLFPNVFEIFFLYYLAVGNSVYMKPPILWYALSIITVTVLIREFIIHLKKMNFSYLFFRQTTYWLMVNQNRYKALGFVVFLVLFAFTFSAVMNKDPLVYKSKAMFSTNEGKIILYGQEGTLMGWIREGNQPKIKIFLFAENKLEKPRCVIISDTIPYSVEPTASLFIVHSSCFSKLKDGNYVLLVETQVPLRKVYRLELKVVGGALD